MAPSQERMRDMGLKRVAFRSEVTSSDPDDDLEDVTRRVRDHLASGGEWDLAAFTVLSAAEDPTEGDRFTPLPGPVPE